MRIRRTLIATAVALATAAAMSLVTPAEAQTIGPMQLDEHEGVPGDVVTGAVDPAVVAGHCPNEPIDLRSDFLMSADTWGPVDGELGPESEQFFAQGPVVGIEPPPDGDWPGVEVFPGFWDGGFGPPPSGVPDINWAWRQWWNNIFLQGVDWEWNRQIQGALAIASVIALVGTDQPGSNLARSTLFPEYFIFTFADINTQQPLGDMSNFDPDTGVSVEDPPLLVPDLEPGIWPVIMTCIDLRINADNFLSALDNVTAFLDEIDYPQDGDPFNTDAEYVEGIARAAIAEFATPGDGLWVDLYCILDDGGVCHPELRGIDIDDLTEEELEEFLEELLAEEAAEDAAADAALAAETEPRFTG